MSYFLVTFSRMVVDFNMPPVPDLSEYILVCWHALSSYQQTFKSITNVFCPQSLNQN